MDYKSLFLDFNKNKAEPLRSLKKMHNLVNQ